jgi:hypothetical protein
MVWMPWIEITLTIFLFGPMASLTYKISLHILQRLLLLHLEMVLLLVGCCEFA